MITGEQLLKIMPGAARRVGAFVAPLNAAMREFGIDENPARETAFLAQVAHESGQLRWLEEIASGERYEGRRDLGNIVEGDGKRFKGRGLLQITGRANYRAVGDALGIDLLVHPERLADPDLACRSAAWFWEDRGLNELADKGDFLAITKRINGGTNGWVDRLAYFTKAKEVLA